MRVSGGSQFYEVKHKDWIKWENSNQIHLLESLNSINTDLVFLFVHLYFFASRIWSTEKMLEWAMDYSMYKDQLIDQAALMLTLSGRVQETQQVLATQFNFRLKTPDLNIKVRNTTPGKYYRAEDFIPDLTFVLYLFCSHTANRGGCGRKEDGSGDFLH